MEELEEEFFRVCLSEGVLPPQLLAVEGVQQAVRVAHADGVALDQCFIVLTEVFRTHTPPLVPVLSS